jgi:N-methylhydantoinase B/oxoprolinase/acetone carboxylase alpha subunit
MKLTPIDAGTKVSRNRVVYAQNGHMVHASHYDTQRSLRQWDYYLASYGGLGGITGRDGKLVSLRLRNGAIYLN